MFYNFYFDEIFHDPKITIKEDGVINALKDNTNESYIGVFWGYESSKEEIIYGKILKLEEKYIERFGIKEEFKSKTIGKKHFQYGLSSFNNITYDFYNDMFTILEEVNPIIHVNMASKIELLVRNIFDGNELRKRVPIVNVNAFYYSMTKFILFYHSPQLLKVLYETTITGKGKKLSVELHNYLGKIISATEGIERKQREVLVFKELQKIVSLYRFKEPICNKYDFIYFQNFDGLVNLLEEKRILLKDVNLTIDKEEKTYKAAVEYKFNLVQGIDSTECLQVRIADHLCGFIGRMMYALTHDRLIMEDSIDNVENLQENDLTRKHLLSPQWFMIDEEKFTLYKKIYTVLIVQQNTYWGTMTWSYADQTSMFYILLRYFASYETFEEYKSIDTKLHCEYYNAACIDDLERHYMNLEGHKLPFQR